MDTRRERGCAEELISLSTGIFGRRLQRRLSDKVGGTIVVSWGSVAEIWLNLRDNTDIIVLDWHDPSVTLAAKYAAFGAAALSGVGVNRDPGVHHVGMLTRLLRRAPERV